jgi:hypothetical protein
MPRGKPKVVEEAEIPKGILLNRAWLGQSLNSQQMAITEEWMEDDRLVIPIRGGRFEVFEDKIEMVSLVADETGNLIERGRNTVVVSNPAEL